MIYNNTEEEDFLKNQSESDDTTDESDEEEDFEAIKAELEKARRDYHNQKIRAEKAEAQAKAKSSGRETVKSNSELSTFDIIAVTKADLDEDGLKEVMDFAKFKNISVAEALKSPVMKATLAEKKENDRVAEATNVNGSRRGSTKLSDEALLANAQKGNMPESDADLDRLLKLRRGR